jgi:DNA-binding HxlR family transcriptional regulator
LDASKFFLTPKLSQLTIERILKLLEYDGIVAQYEVPHKPHTHKLDANFVLAVV